MLARAFMEAGHVVTVMTAIEDPDGEIQRDYDIVRSHRWQEIFRVSRWADVCLVLGPSVKYVLPALLLGRRVMVSHAAPFETDRRPLAARLQYLASTLASWTLPAHGPSRSIWAGLPRRRVLFPNPYDAKRFRLTGEPRTGELLYVGRLSREKGVDTLLHALAKLRAAGRDLHLTILGKGSHEPELQQLVAELGLRDAVHWYGLAYGDEVASVMNRHRVLVVPSRWHEPFGIVALEGLGCGCRVVVARHGGLTEAAGRWGYVFENGDPESLAGAIAEADDAPFDAEETLALQAHLAQHQVQVIAQRYLDSFAGDNKGVAS